MVVDRTHGEEVTDGEEALHGGADHRHAAGGGSGHYPQITRTGGTGNASPAATRVAVARRTVRLGMRTSPKMGTRHNKRLLLTYVHHGVAG